MASATETETKLSNFIEHLQTGIHISKVKKTKLGRDSRLRRVLEVDAEGKSLTWRQVNVRDYKDENEFQIDNPDDTPYDLSTPKTPVPLYTLQRVLFNREVMMKTERFKIRLDFKGFRTLDFECTSRDDFYYLIAGFELIKKNREKFKTSSYKETLLADEWSDDHYEPLIFKYNYDGEERVCEIGCGNDVEDILLISACYGCLWSFLLGFFGLLLKGVIDSDESSTMLMQFMFFGIFFIFMVGLAVVTGQIEEQSRARKAASKWKHEGEEGEAMPIEE